MAEEYKDLYRRQKEYAKRSVRMIRVDLVQNTEGDLIDWIDAQPNKAGYIKQLIREDMKRHEGDDGKE